MGWGGLVCELRPDTLFFYPNVPVFVFSHYRLVIAQCLLEKQSLTPDFLLFCYPIKDLLPYCKVHKMASATEQREAGQTFKAHVALDGLKSSNIETECCNIKMV